METFCAVVSAPQQSKLTSPETKSRSSVLTTMETKVEIDQFGKFSGVLVCYNTKAPEKTINDVNTLTTHVLDLSIVFENGSRNFEKGQRLSSDNQAR